MYDVVPFRELHMTSRYVSWTYFLPATHYLLVCLSHPLHCLTTASKRSFSCAPSLISQLSNNVSISPFLLSEPHTFPSLVLFVQKMLPLIAPKRSAQAGCGSVTHTALLQSSFMGHQWYEEPQHWARTPLYPILHKHRAKSHS